MEDLLQRIERDKNASTLPKRRKSTANAKMPPPSTTPMCDQSLGASNTLVAKVHALPPGATLADLTAAGISQDVPLAKIMAAWGTRAAAPVCSSALYTSSLPKARAEPSLPTITSDEERVALGRRVLSFNTLRRSRTTLEDIVLSYFPLHGLGVHDLLTHWPLLVHVEGLIYALDEENEDICLERVTSGKASKGISGELEAILWATLRTHGLLDDGGVLEAELQSGFEYWKLEQSVCMCLGAGLAVNATDAMRCSALKSFDFRVLNLLLFQLTKRPYDDALMAFLRVDEMLIDIADDLTDYEDDVVRNSFNIYRVFIALHGTIEGPKELISHISRLEGQNAALLASLPKQQRAQIIGRRLHALAVSNARTWQLPSAIADEDAFRKSCMADETDRS